MNDIVYYIIEKDHIERAMVRNSFTPGCYEVKFEGRDWYSLIDKDTFINCGASRSYKKALKILIEQLQSRQDRIRIEDREIDNKINNAYKELSKCS